MEILMADKIEDIIRVLNFKDTEAEKIEDKLLSKFLKYVHVLAQIENKAVQEDRVEEIDKLFYSRYYWFNKFKERYFALYGRNEGLEQQNFKMLSDYNERFPDKMNWSIIEQIENGVI